MKLTRIQQVEEFQAVKNYRLKLTRFLKLFTNGVFNVSIGGSYALIAQLSEFSKREASDYDFIICAEENTILEIKRGLKQMQVLNAMPLLGSSADAIPVGYVKLPWTDVKAECLFKTIDATSKIAFKVWESPEDILKIKKEYCDKRVKIGASPRAKDVKDIKIIEEALADLPF